ncbi:MAG TPA: SpoIIE family protein phosphatase [Bacteroidota bacterium]|nr:SpoIIE family protein phosphatase [Bacteroidota bacterium]
MKTGNLEMTEAARVHGTELPIEWGVASFKLPGQTESGDQFVIKAFDGGVLIGVIDGLGHGREAAASAKTAKSIMEAHAREPVGSLINLCHKELRKTRGAVMSIASLNMRENSITWIAVGNVTAVLNRVDSPVIPLREYIFSGQGVVGDQLPVLHASSIPISRGDLLMLATDGIRETFVVETSSWGHPQQIADKILAQYSRGNDEALVLVARYIGDRR